MDNKNTNVGTIVHRDIRDLGQFNDDHQQQKAIWDKIRKGFIIISFCCAALLGGLYAALSISSSTRSFGVANLETIVKLFTQKTIFNNLPSNDNIP